MHETRNATLASVLDERSALLKTWLAFLSQDRVVLIYLALTAVILIRTSDLAEGALANGRDITVRGELVCVDLTGGSKPAGYNCIEKGEEFALRRSTGELLFFVEGDERTRIFADPRVRRWTLEIKGRLTGPDEVEIIHLHEIRDGQRILPYYHCDVCNIDAFAPGPCWCCQQEFEFREKVADELKP